MLAISFIISVHTTIAERGYAFELTIRTLVHTVQTGMIMNN